MKALVSKPHLLSRVAALTLGKTIGGPGADFIDIPEPAISPDEVLVKVVKVGSKAAKSWSVGDRIADAVHGGLFPDRGAFAEYLKTDSDLAWKTPADVDDTVAATFDISAVTAMQALNFRLGLPYPDEEKATQQQHPAPVIFLYAGSTSAGLFTIQIAKLAGYTVVTTASPRSTDLVKSYGADAVFNYQDPEVADAIIKQYPDVSLAVDCFSEGKPFAVCDAYPGIEHELIMSYTLFGPPFLWLPPVGPEFPALPDDRKALARSYASLPQLVRYKTLRPPPISLEEGGWDGILAGLDKLRSGKM
ncbi:hypothetical protein EDB81DRAFT_848102 [Dactylonectria macrodidyma]|uniref:Enoyl reductase (ER) domain-containing protein n=1 Tax=Dactylonectria macrodidyma TaxID=307937 RepID=A0A9P9IFT3_9HYPO|nr:hypothetical protein EDB81DRAFT_848102 [Dactylonectria macrodidyma]